MRDASALPAVPRVPWVSRHAAVVAGAKPHLMCMAELLGGRCGVAGVAEVARVAVDVLTALCERDDMIDGGSKLSASHLLAMLA